MKEKFENILEEHGIYGEDIEDVLNAVNEMLCYMCDKTKEDYPYAVNTINRLEIAAYEVYDLRSYL